jgi:ABC-type antimicrobial peptide transport system permease subunit
VENAVLTTLEDPPAKVLYLPVRREGTSFMAPNAISVRGTGDPLGLGRAIQAEVLRLDAAAPLFNVVPMHERVDRVTARYRYSALLMTALAGLALMLAAMGTYGVIAYAVAARTREIGIRMALGARPADVMRLVVGGGLQLAAAGIVLGLAGAYAAVRLLAALLYGVAPGDPFTFTSVTALMASVAALASYLPARRAMRVDPVVSLRSE